MGEECGAAAAFQVGGLDGAIFSLIRRLGQDGVLVVFHALEEPAEDRRQGERDGRNSDRCENCPKNERVPLP